MAYPSVTAPYGFKPINRLDFLPYAGATRQYPVTSGEAVYNGQAVVLAVGGTVEGSASLTTGNVLGVCVGVQYTNSSGQTVQAQYAPATGVSNVIAYVVDDPWALYKVAITGNNQTITPVDATIVGTNVAGVIGTGNATTGDINSSIDGGSADDAATLPFRVVSMVPETIDPTTGLYTECIVKINLSQLLSTTGNALPA
jgi:hypothetical protein